MKTLMIPYFIVASSKYQLSVSSLRNEALTWHYATQSIPELNADMGCPMKHLVISARELAIPRSLLSHIDYNVLL